jgi:hypothetical protein
VGLWSLQRPLFRMSHDQESSNFTHLKLHSSLLEEGKRQLLHTYTPTKPPKMSSSAVTDSETPVLKPDETPISPIERRNSLEKHLQHRPDAQDLKNRNILLDTNAAP